MDQFHKVPEPSRHPLSIAFADMTADERNMLLQSVATIGVQNPAVIYEGKILDGFHRSQAAKSATGLCRWSISRKTRTRDFFVLAQIQARRSSNAGQRAPAVVAIFSWASTGRRDSKARTGCEVSKTNAELTQLAQVGKMTISQAKYLLMLASEEVNASVRSGIFSLKHANAMCES